MTRAGLPVVCLIVLAGFYPGCSEDGESIFDEGPTIYSIAPDSASAGDAVTITGEGFSTLPSDNKIHFSPCGDFNESCSRVAVALSGNDKELTGIVPDGAFTGGISVESAGLFSEANVYGLETPPLHSNLLSLHVDLEQGDLGKIFFSGTWYDFSLASEAAPRDYLVILFNNAVPPSRSTSYAYQFYNPLNVASGFAGADETVAGNDASGERMDRSAWQMPSDRISSRAFRANEGTRARDFKRTIRREVRDLLEQSSRQERPPYTGLRAAITGPGMPPQTVEFDVLVDPDESTIDPANFTVVEAELKFRGDHTLLYVDTTTPGDCVSDTEAADLGRAFDEQIYPTNRNAFGSESDINSDGKVAILLTPVVNRMTPPGTAGTDGYIAGFFLPGDLLPAYLDPRVTNGMEIFYSFVPDPNGHFGNTFEKEKSLGVIEGVLAHEFEHMIIFNYRVLIYGSGIYATYMEELWIDEGLAHIAEDLNGFDISNIARANLFLADPGSVTLIYGGDELDERGASFLFLRYLGDRYGESIFRRLVQSKRTGVTNVEAAVSERFLELFADWSATLYLSGRGITSEELYQYTSLDLVGDFDQLSVWETDFQTSDVIGDVKAMGPEYVLVTMSPSTLLQLIIECSSPGRMNAVIVRLQ